MTWSTVLPLWVGLWRVVGKLSQGIWRKVGEGKKAEKGDGYWWMIPGKLYDIQHATRICTCNERKSLVM